MTTATALRYRKAKTGEWVVFGPASQVRIGIVTVAKADGTTKQEHIESVGKNFLVDGVKCCYGYIDRAGNHGYAGQHAAPQRKTPDGFTFEPGVGLTCDECGSRARPGDGTYCWEMGWRH